MNSSRVSSDPHVATIEKQGVDRGSDFNQDWHSMLPDPDSTTLTLDFD